MAIDGHSKFMRDSIRGRRFGMDHYNSLVGQHGIRSGHETSTAASTLAPNGTSLLNGASSDVYELTPPAADLIGTQKRVIAVSTSASPMYVKLTAGNFLLDGLSSHNTCSLTTRGAALDLEYITTGLISVVARPESTAVASFSTST